MARFFPEKLTAVIFQKKWLFAIALFNVLGTVFGFYYYADQLSSHSLYLWPFIPDSPIATLLIAISFVLLALKKNFALLNSLAFIANLKYGLWTVFILTYYYGIFYNGNTLTMYLFMLLSHFAMAVQALLVLEYSKIRIKHILIAASWFIINDILDYTLGIHTRLYTSNSDPAAIAAFTLTFLSVSILLYLKDSELEHRQQTLPS